MPQVKRWYKGYEYKGNPKQLVEQISQKIREYNLSQYVPLLRLEKGASSRKRFCFFLAIDSKEVGEIPLEVSQSNLLRLPSLRVPAVPSDPCFTYEQIKPMVGVAHDVHDYTNPIPYQTVHESTYDNPFDLIALPPINQPSSDVDKILQSYEQLFYWLCALGNGTWESFKKACEALGLEEPKRILRRLRLLGHIEASLDGLRWSTAPTALVKVKSQTDSQEFVLCGQRNENLLKKLEQYVTVKVINQSRGNALPCIRLELASLDELSHLTEQVRSQIGITIINAGEVSLQLAQVLPELMTWQQGLRSLQGIVPSLYEWKCFDRNVFAETIFCGQTGMYQMWKRTEVDRPLRTLFYDSESKTWRQGDWYGLRFLALHYSNQPCIAQYNSAKALLAVPYSQRWPELYERALVLASGQLPTYQKTEENLWLIYENVKQELAQLLMEKLCISCSESSV